MPATSGIQNYELILSQLREEADATLDSFIATAELGRGFGALFGKVNEQIAAAEKMQNSQSDLELNEAIVLSDKLSEELAALERLASGAALSEMQDEWAEEFEKLRGSLEKMDAHLQKIRHEHASAGKPKTSSHLLFHKHAKLCSARLSKLRAMLTGRKHPIHAKVRKARQRLVAIKSNVGGMLSKIAKIRLKKRIAEAKTGMLNFIEKQGKGRIFVDHRHITFTANGEKMRLAISDPVCFGFEELVPIDFSPAKLAKSFLVGSFEKKSNAIHFRIGERRTVGDSIILKEREFCYG